MNILAQGAALFLTREELAAAHLTPETLSCRESMPLILQALRQAGRPVPPCLEIQCFPSRDGVLFLLRSRVEDAPSDCYFSVTFS